MNPSDYTSIGGPIREPHDIFSQGFGPSRLAEMVKPRNVWREPIDGKGPSVLQVEQELLPLQHQKTCNRCHRPNRNSIYHTCDLCRTEIRRARYRRNLARITTSTTPAQP